MCIYCMALFHSQTRRHKIKSSSLVHLTTAIVLYILAAKVVARLRLHKYLRSPLLVQFPHGRLLSVTVVVMGCPVVYSTTISMWLTNFVKLATPLSTLDSCCCMELTTVDRDLTSLDNEAMLCASSDVVLCCCCSISALKASIPPYNCCILV